MIKSNVADITVVPNVGVETAVICKLEPASFAKTSSTLPDVLKNTDSESSDASKDEDETYDIEDPLEAEFLYRAYRFSLNKRPEVGSHSAELRKLADEFLDKGCEWLIKEKECVMGDDATSYDYLIDGFWDEVPGDCTVDCQFRTSIENVELTFLDEHGHKFEVTVKDD